MFDKKTYDHLDNLWVNILFNTIRNTDDIVQSLIIVNKGTDTSDDTMVHYVFGDYGNRVLNSLVHVMDEKGIINEDTVVLLLNLPEQYGVKGLCDITVTLEKVSIDMIDGCVNGYVFTKNENVTLFTLYYRYSYLVSMIYDKLAKNKKPEAIKFDLI